MQTCRGQTGEGLVQLLGAYEVDDHVDDARAARAAAQVHAGVLDFVLQESVQLPAQPFHQLSHLIQTNRKSV